MLLDKTGTLTEGQFTVTGLELMSKQFTREALKYIGALEKMQIIRWQLGS